MTDLPDELRIIARDGGRLDMADRARISEAADEVEATQRELVRTNLAPIESNAQRIALNEKLLETLRRRDSQKVQPFTMSSGWLTLTVNPPQEFR